MDNDLTFTISYEQLTEVAEEEIKKCNLDKQSQYYPWERTKADAIFGYWQMLASRVFPALEGIERVEEDSKRLSALITQPKGDEA